MKKKIVDSILLSLLFTAVTAGTAMLFVDTQSEWYINLTKPSIQPPPLVFAVAWSVIYLLCAASLTFALLKDEPAKVYEHNGIQTLLNIACCLFYFTLHLPLISFGIILAYLVVCYLTIRQVYSISKPAAWLLVPAALWLAFAAVLNYMILLLN